MKVLVVGSVYPRFPEDNEVPWLRKSVATLRDAGVEVEVMAPSYKGLKSHTIDGVPVHRFRYAVKNLEILTHDEGAPTKMAKHPSMQLLAIPYCISGFFKCLWLAKKKKFDVIHAHWPFPHALIVLGACKLFRIPLVLNFHGAELLLIRKKKWIRPIMKFIIGQANAIFANSRFTASKISALRPAKIEWSPYGSPLSSGKVPPHARGERYKILFVGRHIERKGIEYLIQAAKLLDPKKFEVRIVGKGNLTESLKNLAKEIQTENVTFTGLLSPDDLRKEYQESNCFVLPAIVDSKGDTEGLGVVLVEAMQYGLPVVASNVGGIPDVVVDGETGVLVPEKNPAALAAAFQKLESDPAYETELLKGAEKRINDCFNWEKIAKKQIAVYEKLIGK
ncbi:MULTISPECIES: glycosyltransferase family 4 protein [Hallerella]|uniref:glycosyltransferase family 4 protein n=1 Tax=Hallerella TaxID=2815788 RepID=UPI0025882517|nr:MULTISPECIES: glycosyltransferase family 4 protein [Hallerella]MCI6873805.1 glycosyltransferase family 4 protein [Hallerella sp.]MDY5029944.1 glycosyltransferase family 4 protein [Hallerella succinigenes]